MPNFSVLALRGAFRGVAKQLDKRLADGISAEADGLAAAMRAKASSHSDSGATVKSIQVIAGKTPNRVSVVAGGDLTTKEVRQGSGVSYDYVRAQEFGTQKEKAIPFFFNTYRARKRAIKQRVVDRVSGALD